MKRLTKSFNSITLSPGEVFEIALDSSKSAGGYTWEFEVYAGTATEVARKYENASVTPWMNSKHMRIGAGRSRMIVQFVAASDASGGDIKIIGRQTRQWLQKGSEAPVDVAVFNIKVLKI